MITAAQLRAARGLLDWTRNELAEAAKISPETVKNIEHGVFRPQEQTADAIIKAFAVHDVEFTADEGVRRQKELVKTFISKDGFFELLDHVYSVVSSGNPITRHLALSDNIANDMVPEYVNSYSDKMSKVVNLDSKCLVWEGDKYMPFPYCKYRWLKRSYNWVMPFYLYGNNVAFVMQGSPTNFMAVSVYSEFLSQSFKKQFDVLWEDSFAVQE